ncbi:succinyl-diaminopimelate desuccinylase, partial [Myxococcota bacterium]|nr:succinyl-diaminopimelate desuccinylase [Myxococcota bacterium]
IALVGHLDTVPPEKDARVFRDNDRVTGRGTTDMKSGLAVMQVLVQELDLTELPYSLVLIFYDREEGPYADNGLQPLLDKYEWLQTIDLAIVLEPTDNRIELGCLGTLHACVRFKGKSAHSTRPWQGENAIHKAAPFLTALNQRDPENVHVGGLTFTEAMSVTQAKGGAARNVVPDLFELNLNYRFAPAEDPREAMDQAQQTVRKLAKGAEVEFTDLAPPGIVPVDNPILNRFMKHPNIKIAPKQAWTDVARLALHNIDAVNFGPGHGSQAHQDGEYVEINSMLLAYERLLALLTTPLDKRDIK